MQNSASKGYMGDEDAAREPRIMGNLLATCDLRRFQVFGPSFRKTALARMSKDAKIN